MLNRILHITLLTLVLAACTGARPAPPVTIADGVVMQLLLPDSPLSLTQKITATYQNSQHILIMQIEATPQQVVMAGLTPTGTRLFSLSFDGRSIDSWQSPLFRAPFDGSYVLADFELATLDMAMLRQSLPADVTLAEDMQGHTLTRRLHNQQGLEVIRIQYEGSLTRYCHLERAYCLLIEPL